MSIVVSYRMDEDELVKLMDFHKDDPIGANRGRLLAAIIHGYALGLEKAGKIPAGPLDLAYLEKRLRELLYQRSHSGQIHVSKKRLYVAQQQAIDDIDGDSELDIATILGD